jgi:hypothetical protein
MLTIPLAIECPSLVIFVEPNRSAHPSANCGPDVHGRTTARGMAGRELCGPLGQRRQAQLAVGGRARGVAPAAGELCRPLGVRRAVGELDRAPTSLAASAPRSRSPSSSHRVVVLGVLPASCPLGLAAPRGGDGGGREQSAWHAAPKVHEVHQHWHDIEEVVEQWGIMSTGELM